MPLLYLAVAYLLGIAIGQFLWQGNWFGCNFPAQLWLLPFGMLLLLALAKRLSIFRRRPSFPMQWPVSAGFEIPTAGPSPILLIAVGLCISMGVLRYASHPLTPCWTSTDLAYYNLPADRAFERGAPQVTVIGYITSYPTVTDTKQRLHVFATSLTSEGIERGVSGELRLTTGIDQQYRYGQSVRVHGRLVKPPDFDTFSYREYLARKNVHSLLYQAEIEVLSDINAGGRIERTLYTLRAHGEQLLNRLLPEPYAALANGILLGIEAGIPDELYEQFNLTGVSHTLVISGSNISLLSALLFAMGQKLLGQRRALWPTLLGIAGYALLVGGDAAVLRAAVMGGLFVIATAIDRRSTAIVSLAAACWLMTIANPLTLWDVGFQLSSAATAGLILFSPALTTGFTRLWARGQSNVPSTNESLPFTHTIREVAYRLIQDGLLVTVAANLTTLPLVIYYFGRLSIVSLLTNFAVAPVQPLIMVWGSLGILVGVIGLTWVAWLLLLVPWLSLVWTVAVVQWTAALPGASIAMTNYTFGHLLLTYFVISLFYWRSQIFAVFQNKWGLLRTHWPTQFAGWSVVGVLSVGSLLLWGGVLSQPDGRLHVYFLDIGQGDGILIQTPSGRQVLMDGGASPQQLFNQLGSVMPFWDRTLDLVVLTNPDKDHMAAQAQAPDRFQITTALETKASQANPDAEQWRTNLANAGATVQLQHQGGWIDLGDGVALWVLWPPPEPFLAPQASDEQLFDNENSLILKLVYGDFSVLLTGDAGLPAETALLTTGAPLAATMLKVGHHGSKGSTSSPFIQSVKPMVAVIQVGADNSYGHPHPETLERLASLPVLRNDLHGRIHIYTDGQHVWVDTENKEPSFKLNPHVIVHN